MQRVTVATSLYTSRFLGVSLHRTAHFCHPSKHSVPSPINKVSVKCNRLTISSAQEGLNFSGILGFWDCHNSLLSSLFEVRSVKLGSKVKGLSLNSDVSEHPSQSADIHLQLSDYRIWGLKEPALD